jgi:transposase
MQQESYNLDFKGKVIYAGIDAHLKTWRVSIMTNGVICKTFSQSPKAEDLKKYLESNYPNGTYYSAYEAGFCGFSAHRALLQMGINNIVVNPADVPTTDKERKQKEDSRDSRKIVRSLYNNELEAIYVPNMDIEGLRSLVRYRRTLVKEISRYKNRTKSFLYYNGVEIPVELAKGSGHWSKPYSQWLQSLEFDSEYNKQVLSQIMDTVDHLRKKLLEVNRNFRQLERHSEYSEQIKLLRTVPGVALVTSMTILTELNDMGRFKSIDRLCSYVGLVPRTNSSGDNDRTGGITPRSNRQLRSMLIESAWISIRHDPALMMKYGELVSRMESNKAIVNIAKRLLSRIRYVLKNKTPYVKGFVK